MEDLNSLNQNYFADYDYNSAGSCGLIAVKKKKKKSLSPSIFKLLRYRSVSKPLAHMSTPVCQYLLLHLACICTEHIQNPCISSYRYHNLECIMGGRKKYLYHVLA